jgi:hypothetical protein
MRFQIASKIATTIRAFPYVWVLYYWVHGSKEYKSYFFV